MTIKLPLPKWLPRRFAKPIPRAVTRARLKERQLLRTLPNDAPKHARLQDDDSPPGYRIQWRC
jgi:hypothetical protein